MHSLASLPEEDTLARRAALERQRQLTKPEGSLGRLEALAVWLASWQGREIPSLERVQALVFVGWHGIADKGYSAYPAAVTGQMLANFRAGGAAINQLSALGGAQLSVVPILEGQSTAPFDEGPAMSTACCLQAMQMGFEAVDPQAQLLVLGEMGIGNTSSAAALCTLLFDEPGELWAGAGTGLDKAGVARKADLLESVRQRVAKLNPLAILAEVGGHEIAAMAGAMIAARQARIPLLLDGFVVCAAAAVLQAINPAFTAAMVAGHRSAEMAHTRLLERLGLPPLLELGLRLGEGSGAALALPLLRAAIACHAGMATFAEAGVSDRDA
ncbi:nicotinate-nucleotide-dimethylbenzimidazole phosphoribosyltransferase [Arboricoccus pini]|uniref:Nicotinate-nucleotide--dimethylbenzimidazole phosphoribosyltransferase n=1 Tax=Arboricoccus pini TaxID=1963835 RepID=A0A212QRP9_9PROT|nr:nicotinate-nucleotide--dimethylbenzimidazole phosphoribosyltransferase [Arboricoccus pini]SNB62255.1 nicotinate-nucleotide-dimethylbenzimidazole phosphoribosyltransferase [Arboricoccus pini]